MAKIVSISEAASIALHGVILIAKSQESLNVLQIAESTGASKHHVAKIMQRLAKNGFLTSQRGPIGGFRMKGKAESISFLDIYESIEGKIEIAECPFDKPICPLGKCLMNNVTNLMTIELKEYLRKQTIDQYL